MVAKTFIDAFKDDLHFIIHKDEDTENNRLENLDIVIKEYEIEEVLVCEFRKLKLPKHPSFEEYYEVCNCGQHIRSLRTGKFLKQWMTPKGYMSYIRFDNFFSNSLFYENLTLKILIYDVQMKDSLSKNLKSLNKQRLVAEYFVTKPANYDPKTFEVRFIDKDPKNVRFDNLEWISHKDHHAEIRGKKIKATSKDGKVHVFDSIGDGIKFLEDLMKKKGHYARSIKACLSKYQETAYGFKWEEA